MENFSRQKSTVNNRDCLRLSCAYRFAFEMNVLTAFSIKLKNQLNDVYSCAKGKKKLRGAKTTKIHMKSKNETKQNDKRIVKFDLYSCATPSLCSHNMLCFGPYKITAQTLTSFCYFYFQSQFQRFSRKLEARKCSSRVYSPVTARGNNLSSKMKKVSFGLQNFIYA